MEATSSTPAPGRGITPPAIEVTSSTSPSARGITPPAMEATSNTSPPVRSIPPPPARGTTTPPPRSTTPPLARGITPPPSTGFSNPRELAFYCIGSLLDLCTQYRRTLDRVEATRLLNDRRVSRHFGLALDPIFHVPTSKTLRWLTAAQLRLWNTTKAMLLSCTYRERREDSFAHALGRSEAIQRRLRKLMLGDLSRNEGDALWEFDDTVISMAEALEAFKDMDPISVRWIEGAAVRQVKDEYAQKARLMKEAWYKEKEAHVATKKKMLVKEIRALEKLAEAYREVARLKEKYECGLHPEDDYLQQQQIDDALHQKQIYEAEQPQTDSEGATSQDSRPAPAEPSLGRSLSGNKRKRELNSSGSESEAGTLINALEHTSIGTR
ncbi:uncharacterized protein H6S33_010869 [Morchella sextelata]|uniref:uncharacterized protein n=1 Tax=Morchella sextelata TaxID=1174677 RepID=UPI001D0395C5|nr:uncharacterized protein H6S33_010869 [Morchella sextelata]KAH0611604.1 hypothetical protein H6S33_010869 [Morchella sextelata]